MKREHGPLAAAVVAGLACAAPATAQNLTESELAARFAAQRAAIHAAEINPALGASRGLVLTEIAPDREMMPGATVEAPERPAAAAATGGLVLPGATTSSVAEAGPAAPDAPVEETPLTAHWDLPVDEQVNIQITFAFDSAALDDSQKPLLREICGALDAADVGVMRIVGHTDAAGPAGYNQQLSVLRAEEVERFFVTDCQIAPDRLQAIGVGEQFPYDEHDPLAGSNRRVEFQAIS